eukprot:327076-Alexandrium_andersonii.AAC.1
MPIAALLSAQTRRPAEKPRSMAIEAMPTPSAAPFMLPANSAPPELSAIIFCVVDQRFVVCAPRTQAPPRVDRRARKHPAKPVPRISRIAAPSSRQGKP